MSLGEGFLWHAAGLHFEVRPCDFKAQILHEQGEKVHGKGLLQAESWRSGFVYSSRGTLHLRLTQSQSVLLAEQESTHMQLEEKQKHAKCKR